MGTVRSRSSAALVALAVLASGLVLVLGAAPAQAAWTDVSGLVHYRVCKQETPSGTAWTYRSRARKKSGTPDARAGAVVVVDGDRRQQWGSGWLRGRSTGQGTVRHHKQRGVRVEVWQEAGDRDGSTGTALERRVLRPRDVQRC